MQPEVSGAAYIQAGTGDAAIDTDAIQGAIDVLPEQGGTIYLEPDNTYVVNKLLIPSNVRLTTNLEDYPLGGHWATLQANDELDDNLIRNKTPTAGNTNITIDHLHFEGNSAGQTPLSNPCHAIGFYNVSNAEIYDCTFEDVEFDGVYLGANGSVNGTAIGGPCRHIVVNRCDFTDIRRNGISITRWEDVSILNCTFTDCNLGVLDDPLYTAGAIDFETNEAEDECDGGEVGYCTFSSQYASSIQVAGSGITTDIHIHHNTFAQSDTAGAIDAFTPVDGLLIEDNVIVSNGARGIWINGQEQDMLNVTAQRNTVTGNDTATLPGIGFVYVTNGLIDDNHVTDFARGVLVSNSDTVAITNNEFTSCADDIDIGGGSTNVTQSGNIVN